MYLEPRFAISTFTAGYGRYIPVRQVVGTRTARYQAVPPKIDRRPSIEQEKGKKKKKRKKKKKKRKEEKKNTYRLRAVLARAPSPLACRRRSRVAGAFSPARGERSRRRCYWMLLVESLCAKQLIHMAPFSDEYLYVEIANKVLVG
ncbi:hypothetical protein GW17_00001731 [Ensete ventricosum]|nr:hypothetical protein GW17_00001731 [Ensete ventricosum]